MLSYLRIPFACDASLEKKKNKNIFFFFGVDITKE